MKNEPIQLKSFDVVMREKDYVLYYLDKPLLTRAGRECSHGNPRLLQAVLMDLFLENEDHGFNVPCCQVFSYQRDLLEDGKDLLKEHFRDLLFHDFYFRNKLEGKPGEVTAKIAEADIHLDVLNIIFLGGRSLVKSVSDFLHTGEGTGEKDLPATLAERYDGLVGEQKAVMAFLCARHDAGVILPFLFVCGFLSAVEYVQGLFIKRVNEVTRGTGRDSFAEMIGFPMDGKGPVPDFRNPSESFGLLLSDARRCLDYLSCAPDVQVKSVNLADLIRMGESTDLEFKSTLRWDIRAGKNNPAIEHASLKTITAFLNTNGGILMIGVRDDGSIEGLESDKFTNEDKFLLHFWNLVKSSMGSDVSPYVHTRIEHADGKAVCIVKCSRSSRPVFLRQAGFDEEFYIRTGPGSVALKLSEALKYIADRFPES